LNLAVSFLVNWEEKLLRRSFCRKQLTWLRRNCRNNFVIRSWPRENVDYEKSQTFSHTVVVHRERYYCINTRSLRDVCHHLNLFLNLITSFHTLQ
jgi:hypothetical protein